MINTTKLHPLAQLPEYAHEGDSGADLRSVIKITIKAGEWETVPTGLAIDLPIGQEAQVRSRSGLASKKGIAVLNSPESVNNCTVENGMKVLNDPGTVDSPYIGEIKVILINHSKVDFVVEVGDKIAQLVIAPVINNAEFNEVDSIDRKTSRGEDGFGSTGN
jgi:dUTP pyrophosphatase